MHCPKCGQIMDKEAWTAGHRLGNPIVLEIVFWLVFLLVFLTGAMGIIAATVGIGLVIALNWSKARYSCPCCGHRAARND